jgi:hypothetical protein
MTTWKMLLTVLLCASLGLRPTRADEKEEEKGEAKPPAPGGLIVIDKNGKEHRLARGKWRFATGTTRLPWLAAPDSKKLDKEDAKKEDKEGDAKKENGEGDAKKEDKKAVQPKAPAGPEALVFREEKSTNLLDGILTHVLLDRIRAIDYDPEKKTVTVHVVKAGSKGADEEVLEGSTRYKGENMLTIEAETDLGELGVAKVKFQTRGPKAIKGIRFPRPKAPPADKGRPASVTAADKDETVHKVTDLQPLYLLGNGTQRLIPTLMFQKTVKIDVGKIQKLSFVKSGEKGGDNMEFEVALKDGKELTLSLLDRTSPLDGKPAKLLGLVGRVPAGCKFFPIKPSPNHTFTAVQFGDPKKEEDKKDDKKEEKKEKGKKVKEDE